MNFSEAMDTSREMTEKLLDELSEHLLNGVDVQDLAAEVYLTLMAASHESVVNSTTWLLVEGALNRAAERGMSNDDPS